MPSSAIASVATLWSTGHTPSKDKATDKELSMGLEEERLRNSKNLEQYADIVGTLVTLIEGGTL